MICVGLIVLTAICSTLTSLYVGYVLGLWDAARMEARKFGDNHSGYPRQNVRKAPIVVEWRNDDRTQVHR